MFLCGIWGCFFRSIFFRPQELSLCLFSCNRIRTWPGYILSCVSSYIPELAMINYVQHFQNIFVWGRETWQFFFCKVQHSPRPWWDCQSSSALLWGLEKAPVLQCHHPLETLSSLLKLRSFCVSSLNLSVFLFHKMIADENKLHHPYLQASTVFRGS